MQPDRRARIDGRGPGALRHCEFSTGAFVEPERGFLQSTGFVLNPDGQVVVSVYSSGAIGRLVPDDVIGLIRYLRDHAPATDSEEEA